MNKRMPIIETRIADRIVLSLNPFISWLQRKYPQVFGRPDAPFVHASAMRSQYNWVHKFVFSRIFKNVTYDVDTLAELKIAALNSTVIYLVGSMGQTEYLYFNHLFLKEGLPLVSFTNACSIRRWLKWGDFWNNLRLEEADITDFGDIPNSIEDGSVSKMISEGKSVLITIPPSELDPEDMIFSEPIKALRYVVEAASHGSKNITIVPLDFVWSLRPENARRGVFDILFGEKESPGLIRRMALFLRHLGKAGHASIAHPINLNEFIKQQSISKGEENITDALRKKLMSVLRAKRRTLLGPPIRPCRWFLEEIANDEELDRLICKMSAEHGKIADDLRMMAHRYAKEIVADVNYTYLELFDKILGFVFRRMFENFNIDMEGLTKLKDLYAEGPIVFVPNHKSHLDYLILSHLLYHNGMTVPYIAAGNNLSFWPLGSIFKHCGGFFIRRAFKGNELYGAVLETYLKVLLREGYCQEFFIEGSRSRTGKLLKPRKGMLSMLHAAAKANGQRFVTFIPVAITYDRVVEQKSFVDEQAGGVKKEEGKRALLKLSKFLKRRTDLYGSVYVKFGKPVVSSTEAYEKTAMTPVAHKICNEINKHIVVTPSAIAATVLLVGVRRGLLISDYERNYEMIYKYLKHENQPMSERFSGDINIVRNEAIEELVRIRLVGEERRSLEPYISLHEERRLPLSFYKNNIVHYLVSIGVVCRFVSLAGKAGMSFTCLTEEVEKMHKLLEGEFGFAKSRDIQNDISAVLKFLASEGAVTLADNLVIQIKDKSWIIFLFANVIQPFIDTIFIATRHVQEIMNEEMEEKVLLASIMQTGMDLYYLGRIQYREAVNRAGFSEAIRTLTANSQLKLERTDQKGRRYYIKQ